jgi:hypothetical protein
MSFLGSQDLHNNSRMARCILLWLLSSNTRSQSLTVLVNFFSLGSSQSCLMLWRRALAFVHSTVAWKLSSTPFSHIGHMLWISSALLHLFLYVSRLSEASLQLKTQTLFGTKAFQMLVQILFSPLGLLLVLLSHPKNLECENKLKRVFVCLFAIIEISQGIKTFVFIKKVFPK